MRETVSLSIRLVFPASGKFCAPRGRAKPLPEPVSIQVVFPASGKPWSWVYPRKWGNLLVSIQVVFPASGKEIQDRFGREIIKFPFK